MFDCSFSVFHITRLVLILFVSFIFQPNLEYLSLSRTAGLNLCQLFTNHFILLFPEFSTQVVWPVLLIQCSAPCQQASNISVIKLLLSFPQRIKNIVHSGQNPVFVKLTLDHWIMAVSTNWLNHINLLSCS